MGLGVIPDLHVVIISWLVRGEIIVFVLGCQLGLGDVLEHRRRVVEGVEGSTQVLKTTHIRQNAAGIGSGGMLVEQPQPVTEGNDSKRLEASTGRSWK